MWTKLQRDLCTEHAAVADQFPSVTSSRVVDPALMESQLSQEPDENQRDLLNQLPKAKATVSGKDLRHSLKELGSEVSPFVHTRCAIS